jgi:prepilin-type N-terminal cleavage/methylation domain-containing protein
MMSAKRGFTLIELLVVIAIIAILVAMLLPAVQQVREAARKSQCQDHLHNLGVAVHDYESSFKTFPPGYVDQRGAPGGAADNEGHWAWSAMILPYVEQKPLYDLLNVGQSTASQAMAANQKAMQTSLELFRCPSSTGPEIHDGGLDPGYAIAKSPGGGNHGLALANYVASNNTTNVRQKKAKNGRNGTTGAVGPFYRDSNIKFRDMVDGSSNTFLFGERCHSLGGVRMSAATLLATRDADAKGPAAQDASVAWNQGLMTVAGSVRYSINPTLTGPNQDRCQGYSSLHPGGAQFALGDGKVTFISENVDIKLSTTDTDSVLEALVGIDDGVPVKVP